MMAKAGHVCLLFGVILGPGCAGMQRDSGTDSKGPRTLLSWSAGRDTEPESSTDSDAPRKPEAEDTIVTDRPDFTEASSTVGKGRIQLEAGYTCSSDRSIGVTSTGHSYPEALLRIGVLADWFEFRIAQNFGHAPIGTLDGVFLNNGAEDLYLGVKLGLTEQKRVLPEVALILQTNIPTGDQDLTSGKIEPGFNLLYGWDVIEDLISIAGSSQANRGINPSGRGYLELAQSLTVGYTLTDRVGAYTEWFAIIPASAMSSEIGPEQYFNGGFTFRPRPNIQFDIRAGVGLNQHATDFFAGSGFAVRY